MALARWAWRTEAAAVGGVAPERLTLLDGRGAPANTARLHGRGPRGTRAHGSAPRGRRERLAVLGALGYRGVIAAMGAEAATGARVFYAYLDRVPPPESRRTKPDAAPVMDNLAAHEAPRVRALLDGSGLSHRHLPACSPDLNPIEPAWAKAKAEPRSVAARTVDALHEAPGPALASVTPPDAAGRFRHCGHARPG